MSSTGPGPVSFSPAMPADYRTRIRSLHRSLGIPAAYATRRHMPLQPEARRLVTAGRAADDGKPVRLAPRAAAAWRNMRDAARRDGIELLPLSGYRSVVRQAALIRQRLADGQTLAEILRLVAAPGCSEHHTGRALDIGSPDDPKLDVHFAKTREFRWLKRHAVEFRFFLSYPRKNAHGIAYEPWHWCWKY